MTLFNYGNMNEKSFFFNIKLASTQMCMKKQVGDTGSGEPLVSIYFLWRVRLDRIIIKFFLKSKIFKNLKYFFITVWILYIISSSFLWKQSNWVQKWRISNLYIKFIFLNINGHILLNTSQTGNWLRGKYVLKFKG